MYHLSACHLKPNQNKMAMIKLNLPLCIVLFSLFLATVSSTFLHDDNPDRDPRWKYQQCTQSCQSEEGRGAQQRCLSKCRKQFLEQPSEREDVHVHKHERRDPEQEIRQCKERCIKGGQRRGSLGQCIQQCEELRRHQRETPRWRGREEEEQEGQESNSPYHFRSQRFRSRFSSDDGHISVVQRFTERSELLRGIENYRVAVVEANPNTFIVPHHNDAETVMVCLQGKGTISLINQKNKDSFNLERGDVLVVPAGTTLYVINRDDNEKLRIAKLLQPVNVPGLFKEYSMVGRQNPQSYFSVFSNEILETALQTPRDELEGLFERSNEGMIIRASEQQLKALAEHVSKEKHKGSKSKGPINLFNQKPLYSNNHGQFFEISPEDNKQFQEIDVLVTAVEINKGSMILPHYNSKITELIIVEDGYGEIEMACPHVSMERQRRGEIEEEEEISGEFHLVRASVSPGDLFVLPAGHPIVVVASPNQNLSLIGIGVNARNNQRNFIAGKENMINQIDQEALSIAFNIEGKRVQQVFRNQPESFFAAGPQQGQREERGQRDREVPLTSILDFAGY